MEIQVTRVHGRIRTLAGHISALEDTVRIDGPEWDAVVKAARQDIDHINSYVTDLDLIRRKRLEEQKNG